MKRSHRGHNILKRLNVKQVAYEWGLQETHHVALVGVFIIEELAIFFLILK